MAIGSSLSYTFSHVSVSQYYLTFIFYFYKKAWFCNSELCVNWILMEFWSFCFIFHIYFSSSLMLCINFFFSSICCSMYDIIQIHDEKYCSVTKSEVSWWYYLICQVIWYFLIHTVFHRILSMYDIQDEDIDGLSEQSSASTQPSVLQMQVPVLELLKVCLQCLLTLYFF